MLEHFFGLYIVMKLSYPISSHPHTAEGYHFAGKMSLPPRLTEWWYVMLPPFNCKSSLSKRLCFVYLLSLIQSADNETC